MASRANSLAGRVGAGLLAILSALVCPATSAAAAQPLAERSVLLLYAESRHTPGIASLDREIRATLESSAAPIRLYTEHLDASWFPEGPSQRAVLELLRQKYRGRTFDLVIPAGPAALQFALAHRATIFGGAPIVFVAALRSMIDDREIPADVAGTWLSPQWDTNLELILTLHPDTRHIALVYGTSAFDRSEIGQFRAAFARQRPGIELLELTDLPLDEVLRKVAVLPDRTVIMLVSLLRDGAGRDVIAADAAAAISRAARVPVYGASETFVGRGVVGGHVISFVEHGRQAAALATRVLAGEHVASVHQADTPPNIYMFDARALRRWGISESRLPLGSLVMYREPSVWTLYRWHIVGGLSLIAIQMALIAGLLVQRGHRMRAQHALKRNLHFEQLVSEISNTFATVAPAHVDAEIQRALGRIIVELGFNRGSLIEFIDDPRFVRVTHSVTTPGVAPLPATLAVERFPWAIDTLRRGDVVRFTALDRLPPDAATDRAAFLDVGTQSIVCVPLDVGGATVGGLSFSTPPPTEDWPDSLIQRLRLLGEIFANALVRRRAEGAVRESEERFRLIADTAPVMVWMAGADGRCTYLNRGWLEFTGRRMDEQLGDGWADGVHPDDRERCVAHYRRALEKREEFVIEYRLRRRDGEYRWLTDHGVPRLGRDGTFSGYVGACTDITDMKAAHTATLKSVALRSAIFGSLYGHVAAVDRQGHIVAVNESWARFGETGGWDTLRPPVGTDYLAACRGAAAEGHAVAQQIEEAVRSVVDGHRQRTSLEYATRSGSEERWFDMNVEPFRHPDGGAIVSHLDVTRRRLAEVDARRQREQLAHALRVTTLGELAASLAHEISQPLAAILSNAQAARLVLTKEPQHHEDLHGAVLDIVEDAKRAALVIRRLRALLRKEWAERKYVDVNTLVVEVANLLHADLKPKGVLAQLSLTKDVTPVLGDAIQLQQVLLNVVMNASDAMVAASTPPSLLTIETAHGPDGTVEITVSDTGSGVAEGELERIFEPFVTSKKTGLGMGLSISRSIVQAHGGRIWATRNDERGLTVHIELPCEEDGIPR